jgi:putative FmdB family regulatory protein
MTMPIYEFKCMQCQEFIEILLMNKDEEIEIKCPKCNARDLERVLSTTNFNMDGRPSKTDNGANSQTRSCSSGSCTTYNIPGPNG